MHCRSPSGAMCPIASLVLQASVLGATTQSYLFYWSCSILHSDYERCMTRHDIEVMTALSGHQTVTCGFNKASPAFQQDTASEDHIALTRMITYSLAKKAADTHRKRLSIVYKFVDSSRHLSHIHSKPHTPFSLSLLSVTVKSFSSPPR